VGALDPLINAPRPQKLIFGTMLLVILGALAYFFLISGARAERDTLLEENEVRRAEVIKAKADEANLRPFRAQAEVLRRKLDTAKERLPSEREIPQVYRQVSDLATQSGLAPPSDSMYREYRSCGSSASIITNGAETPYRSSTARTALST